MSAQDAVLLERYRKLIQEHLAALPKLFQRLTGLNAGVAWAPSWPRPWSAHDLPNHSGLCRELVAGSRGILARCRQCAGHRMELALKSGHDGHRFTCFMGVRNYWLPVIIRGCAVGLAFVQAPTTAGAGATGGLARKSSGRSRVSKSPPRRWRHTLRGFRPVSGTQFGEASRLLQLVFQHAETSALAELRKLDLTRAQRALRELQTVATRLRGELNGLVPVFSKTAPVLEPENHAERVVHATLEYIRQHYREPFTLQECADRLRLNAAYLSSQFSRAVGIPFKVYLTEVRMEKARELLGDFTRSIAEVACAVGYASENRFRIAFKKLTGLSPKVWRETLRMEPLSLTRTA